LEPRTEANKNQPPVDDCNRYKRHYARIAQRRHVCTSVNDKKDYQLEVKSPLSPDFLIRWALVKNEAFAHQKKKKKKKKRTQGFLNLDYTVTLFVASQGTTAVGI
jgi:hypothetical protein